jgi:hypothetical protein
MNPFKYNFVMELFNFNFKELVDLKRKIDDEWVLLRNSGLVYIPSDDIELRKQKHATEIFNRTSKAILDKKLPTVFEFLETVETVEKVKLLYNQLNIPAQYLKEFIWKIEDIIPYKKPLKALITIENKSHQDSLIKLKKLKITNNLALLEVGRTKLGREKILSETTISPSLLSELIHRADFLRGSHISGRTIDHFFKAGYDTVDKIKEKEMHNIIKDFREFENSLGIARKDKIVFKFVIYAKFTPRVVLN